MCTLYSPPSSTFLQPGLASRAYPHLSTKSALQSSTFYCNKSPKSLFYTFSTAVIASLRAQAPFSPLPSRWIEAFLLANNPAIIFHLRLSLLWKHMFLKMLFLSEACLLEGWRWTRGVSWVAFTLLAWQYDGNTFCKERGTKFLYNKMSDLSSEFHFTAQLKHQIAVKICNKATSVWLCSNVLASSVNRLIENTCCPPSWKWVHEWSTRSCIVTTEIGSSIFASWEIESI